MVFNTKFLTLQSPVYFTDVSALPFFKISPTCLAISPTCHNHGNSF